MDRETIRVGDQYGYRKYPQRRGARLERIEVLEKVRPGKWKVRFLDDPYPGLIDYVRSGNLLVSWSEQEAFLDDERRLLKILEASATQWSGQLDDPVAGAINWTLNATGEGDTFLHDYGGRDFGHAELPLDVAKRILMRTDLDWDPLVLDPLGFVDRHGKLHLPFQGALKLAQAFAASEPETVLFYLSAEEKRWEEECRKKGEPISTVDLVQKWRAAWMLARQWSKSASADKAKFTSMEEIRQRVENSMNLLWIKIGEIDRKKTEEIQRLRSMLLRVADDFKAIGAMEKADHLISFLHKDQKLRE